MSKFSPSGAHDDANRSGPLPGLHPSRWQFVTASVLLTSWVMFLAIVAFYG